MLCTPAQSCAPSPPPPGQPAQQQPDFSFDRQQQSAPVVNLVLLGGAANCSDTTGPVGCNGVADVDDAADLPDSYSIDSLTMNSSSHSASSESSHTSELLDASDSLTLISNTPPGVKVVYSPKKGHHLVASANFATGTILYRTSSLIIRRQYDNITILIDGVRHKVSTMNTVARSQEDGTRSVYGFDGFMNHSCVANVWCPLERIDAEWEYYTCVAVRDIKPGDEVTCDYAVFDYDCDGHAIEECWCGGDLASDEQPQPGTDVSSIIRMKCRGAMRGFGTLTFEQKLEVLEYCDEAVIERWEQEERVRVVDVRSAVPPGVIITLDPESTTADHYNMLVAARPFAQHEEIFRNRPYLVSADEYDVQWILRTGEREFRVLTAHQHFIHREGPSPAKGYREMLGFDTFMNHSCEPSVYQRYISEWEYVVYAARAIQEGEELTCDYEVGLGNEATGEESCCTDQVVCRCGSEKCRGLLKF